MTALISSCFSSASWWDTIIGHVSPQFFTAKNFCCSLFQIILLVMKIRTFAYFCYEFHQSFALSPANIFVSLKNNFDCDSHRYRIIRSLRSETQSRIDQVYNTKKICNQHFVTKSRETEFHLPLILAFVYWNSIFFQSSILILYLCFATTKSDGPSETWKKRRMKKLYEIIDEVSREEKIESV